MTRTRRAPQACSRLVLGALAGLGLLVWLPGQAEAADWYNASWASRKKITIDKSKVSGTQTDFPVLINLTTDTDLAADAQDDGDDLLFTSSDGATKLSHELEKFDGTTGQLVAWVKVPSLSSSTNTVLYLYYGNAGATNQQSATAVWDANYKGVWHLKEGTSGTDSIKDSTSNAHSGTPAAGVALNTTGLANGAASFDADNEVIDVTDHLDFDFASNNVTVSAWVKTVSNTIYKPIVEHYIGGSPGSGWYLDVDANNSPYGAGVLFFEHRNTSGVGKAITSVGRADNDQWHYAVVTITSTGTAKMYLDGVLENTDATFTSLNNGNETLKIGDLDGAGGYYGQGPLDEIRISNGIARSAGWITTEYNNQGSPSTFYSVGGEASVGNVRFDGVRMESLQVY